MRSQPQLEIRYVNLKEVHPNPWNPHGTTPDELDELIDSISAKGVVDAPLVVEWDRPVQYEDLSIEPKAKYMLVDGEQRFTATREAFIRGRLERPVIPVTVLGKLSDFTEAELAEIGEALNHRGRGSLEDVKKTGIIAKWLTKNRTVEEAARLMGKDKGFVMRALAEVQKSKSLPLPPSSHVTPPRPQRHAERNRLNVVLPFEDELDVEEFESLVADVELDGDYPTKGARRTAQVMEALRFYHTMNAGGTRK